MADVKPIIIDVDFKKNTNINDHKVRHGDNIPLLLRVFDDGEAFDLSKMQTITLVITRLDRQVIVLEGTSTGNEAIFKLGGTELAVSGSVQVTAQFYDVDGRVSTLNFKLIAELDPTASYIPSEKEETLIIKVLNEGPLILEASQMATIGAQDAAKFASEQGNYAKSEGENVSTLNQTISSTENERIENESSRQGSEQLREENESGRIKSESERVSAEIVRDENEANRIQAENVRLNAEEDRVQQELARQQIAEATDQVRQATEEERLATEEATREALAAAEVARNAQGPKGDPGAIFDTNTNTGVGEIHWWTGTKAEYDAIPVKNNSTIYYVRAV